MRQFVAVQRSRCDRRSVQGRRSASSLTWSSLKRKIPNSALLCGAGFFLRWWSCMDGIEARVCLVALVVIFVSR
jgi:hypothetical protein